MINYLEYMHIYSSHSTVLHIVSPESKSFLHISCEILAKT